jgi:hypothetical protein
MFKVEKIILKSFMYCMKLGFFRLIFGLPPLPLYLAFCRLPFPRQSIRTSPLSMFGTREILRPSQLSRLKTSSLEILDTTLTFIFVYVGVFENYVSNDSTLKLVETALMNHN